MTCFLVPCFVSFFKLSEIAWFHHGGPLSPFPEALLTGEHPLRAGTFSASFTAASQCLVHSKCATNACQLMSEEP